MRYLTRIWTAMAVFGAALVHLAVAAGAPLPELLAFTVIGILELAWAVATLTRGRYLLPRATPPLLLLPLALWAVVAFAGTSAEITPPLALAAASALDIGAAISVAVRARRDDAGVAAADREPSAGVVIGGLLVGALAMSAIALPALGQTPAGIAATEGPHANHTVDLNIDLDHEGH